MKKRKICFRSESKKMIVYIIYNIFLVFPNKILLARLNEGFWTTTPKDFYPT